MEYEKQIEIKLEGNNCIINFPKESNISSNSNIDDISLSISVTSEENTNLKNKNNQYLNSNQYLYSNEKSKLEITCQSIFYSDLKSENSNMKTPFILLNSKKKENNFNGFQQKIKNKESIVKKLNFDINTNNANIKLNEDNNNDNKNINENKFNSNSEIPNKNIKQLPLIKRNKIIKKISKNLNKEYFIYEKIYASNKNIQRIILDKKIKDNSIKNSKLSNQNNNSNSNIKNKTQIIDNTTDIINNNDSNYQITENIETKGNYNFMNKSKNLNINKNDIILNKCSSKSNLSNIRIKLNSLLKPKSKNNLLKEIDIMPKIITNDKKEKNINNLISKKLTKNNVLYPTLTSGNFNSNSNKAPIKSPNLNLLNSFNKSANNNKIKSCNINNENSNSKTPLILNKQIFFQTPKTNSYSCSTSYSATTNKIQNEINTNSDIKKENHNINNYKDPILCRVEAHNSYLRNFLMNKSNNFSNNNININNNFIKENKENIPNNIDNIIPINKFNNNTNEKNYGRNFLEESINNKQIRLKKFNTDFKLPINKYKKIGLLTERNLNSQNQNIFLNDSRYFNNANDAQRWFKKNEFDKELLNSFKK